MGRFKKIASLFLTLVIIISSLPAQYGAAAANSNEVYSIYDLNLTDGANVPNIPEEDAIGKFGVIAGEPGSVVYREDASGDYVRLTYVDENPDHVPAFGFILPNERADSLIAVEYKLRLNDALANDKYITSGFDDGTRAPGFDNYNVRTVYNNNCQMLIPNSSPWRFEATPYAADSADGKVKTDVWYAFKIIMNMNTGDYEVYVGDTPTLMYEGTCLSPSQLTRFLISYGNWGGNPALTYDIKDFQVTVGEIPDEPGPGPDPDPGPWALDLSGYSEDTLLPDASAGTFGQIVSGAGTIAVKQEGAGKYLRYEHSGTGTVYNPSFGFILPETVNAGKVTAEYKIRVPADSGMGLDHYVIGEFNNGGTPGDSSRAASAMLKGSGQITDRLPNPSVNYDIGSLSSEWYSFALEADLDNHTFNFYNNGDKIFSQAMPQNSGGISKFLIYEDAWGSPYPVKFDIKDIKISLDSYKPYIPPVGAENTWILNDQLAAAGYTDGADLANYEADSGKYGAYFSKAGGSIKVKGNTGAQVVELAYSAQSDNRGSPSFVLDMPEEVSMGKVAVDFEMLIKPGSSSDWLEAGIGSDCLGSGDIWATKMIYNGGHMIQSDDGWRGVGGYSQGTWYRYVLTADFSMKTMSVNIYAPGDTEPSQNALYSMKAAKAKKFVVKAIATGSTHQGVIQIKNAAVSYIPPDKKPALIAPANGSMLVPFKPEFIWSSTGAGTYTLEISKSADFSEDVIRIEGITTNTYTPAQDLDEFTPYYWRVTSVFVGDENTYMSDACNFISDIQIPEDNIYRAGDFDLIPGNWNEWSSDTGVEDIPKHNTTIIQGLLDKAGRSGGGTVLLPEGTYCITGDVSSVGSYCLTIKYDDIKLIGAGKDDDGKYKTVLKTNYQWDGPNGVYRSGGIYIQGENFGQPKARQNIEISHFEMDGGFGWNGKNDWGYDPTVDYGWDINHKGINVSQDKLVTHVTLDDLYVHKYSGETVYVGGKAVGYIEVKNCTFADTNASCFNLYAAYLNVHDNQFGTPDTKCRFWIEYCARASQIDYTLPEIPEGLERDHAYFNNNKFYNSVDAHGIAIAQGDCTTYTLSFENNLFDNRLAGPGQGLFQFAGAVYGPTYMKNNTIQNFAGPLVVFDYGGGTEPVDHLMNKNIYFEDNHGTNLGGPFISLVGTWGIWVGDGPIPALQPVENLVVRNNYFEGSSKSSKSVAISNSWDMIESAVDLKGVLIEGNTFKNCTEPEELRVFMGNVPLFKGNQYIDTVATIYGGIAELTPQAPIIKPVYEKVTAVASAPLTAQMRTGRNEDTQQVTITGGAGTHKITFAKEENSYQVSEDKVLGAGDKIVFNYDAESAKWIFVSFEAAPVTTTPSAPSGPIHYAGVKGSGTDTPIPVIVDNNKNNAAVDMGKLAETLWDGIQPGKTAVVSVPTIAGINSYTLKIPSSGLSQTENDRKLTFETALGNITVSDNMLTGIVQAKGKDVAITVEKGEKALLPDEVKKSLGDRPMVQLTMTVDDKKIEWSNPDAPVTVAIPYKPTAAELQDPEHIVVWYIDGNGNVATISSGRYDPEAGTVTFSTTHFSHYAVAFVQKTFSDLDKYSWAKKQIGIMTSKEIIGGTGKETYSPGAGITRGDFVAMLVKALGLTASFEDNFTDVEEGINYYEAVGIAKKLGITAGVGNNRFNPKENISRQDMMVLTALALEKYRNLKTAEDVALLDRFTDRKDIAHYAVEKLAALVREGLIEGSGERLNPGSFANRAEAAVLLYKIYNK